mmetsp:Transcript_10907/g.21111  ORF Transcript_10907/g.21111 Transcript_10907/m.21111 type:complete len:81 (-) Transcript_10907:1573-1815(-)
MTSYHIKIGKLSKVERKEGPMLESRFSRSTVICASYFRLFGWTAGVGRSIKSSFLVKFNPHPLHTIARPFRLAATQGEDE